MRYKDVIKEKPLRSLQNTDLSNNGKATSRTPSMYVDEKSDEAILLAKRLNKGRQKGLTQGE